MGKLPHRLQWAIESCPTMGYEPGHQFRGVTKLITRGKSGQREIEDFMLTRHACYLVIQNADPSKKSVAQGQTYFAIRSERRRHCSIDTVLAPGVRVRGRWRFVAGNGLRASRLRHRSLPFRERILSRGRCRREIQDLEPE